MWILPLDDTNTNVTKNKTKKKQNKKKTTETVPRLQTAANIYICNYQEKIKIQVKHSTKSNPIPTTLELLFSL